MPKTLIVGIQDLDSNLSGPGLRVYQHLNCIPNATYYNVGNKIPWSKLSLLQKIKFMLIKFTFKHEIYSTYHYSDARAKALYEYIRLTSPDIIILSELWSYRYLYVIQDYICDYSACVKVIADLHNMESNLQEEIMINSKGLAKLVNKYRLYLIKRIENLLFNSVCEIWVCSKDDYQSYTKSDIYF